MRRYLYARHISLQGYKHYGDCMPLALPPLHTAPCFHEFLALPSPYLSIRNIFYSFFYSTTLISLTMTETTYRPYFTLSLTNTSTIRTTILVPRYKLISYYNDLFSDVVHIYYFEGRRWNIVSWLPQGVKGSHWQHRYASMCNIYVHVWYKYRFILLLSTPNNAAVFFFLFFVSPSLSV